MYLLTKYSSQVVTVLCVVMVFLPPEHLCQNDQAAEIAETVGVGALNVGQQVLCGMGDFIGLGDTCNNLIDQTKDLIGIVSCEDMLEFADLDLDGEVSQENIRKLSKYDEATGSYSVAWWTKKKDLAMMKKCLEEVSLYFNGELKEYVVPSEDTSPLQVRDLCSPPLSTLEVGLIYKYSASEAHKQGTTEVELPVYLDDEGLPPCPASSAWFMNMSTSYMMIGGAAFIVLVGIAFCCINKNKGVMFDEDDYDDEDDYVDDEDEEDDVESYRSEDRDSRDRSRGRRERSRDRDYREYY